MLNPETAPDTAADVRRVPLDRPDGAGGLWAGVRHGDLIDGLLDECRRRGLTPDPPVCRLSRANFDLTASVRFSPPDGGIHPAIGLAASNAKKRVLNWYAGGWCDDGWGFVADAWPAGHRYTTNFMLEVEIESALDRWEAWHRRLPGLVRRLKVRRVSFDVVFDAVDAVRARDALSGVLRNHDGDGSAWAAVATAGRAAGRVSAVRQLDALLAAWRVVNGPNEPRPADEPAKIVVTP